MNGKKVVLTNGGIIMKNKRFEIEVLSQVIKFRSPFCNCLGGIFVQYGGKWDPIEDCWIFNRNKTNELFLKNYISLLGRFPIGAKKRPAIIQAKNNLRVEKYPLFVGDLGIACKVKKRINPYQHKWIFVLNPDLHVAISK